MAGPGGGPPRKSHTKSKKGCKTCKKRHIRCDETYPQCRNCTKHSCKCDYQDSIYSSDEASESSSSLAISSWSPRMDNAIMNWHSTGDFPFPELSLQYTHQFQHLSKVDLGLIYYLCRCYRRLHQQQLLQCAPWLPKLPLFLDAAAGHPYVLSALTAFAATHLATSANYQEMTNLADYHRGLALKTTYEAIGNFSMDNTESILATSIILSWQIHDLAGWTSLMQGISTVLRSMGDWRFTSQLADFAEKHVLSRPAPYGQTPTQTAVPDLSQREQILQDAVTTLQLLSQGVAGSRRLQQIVDEAWRVAVDVVNNAAMIPPEQLFERIQALRLSILWTPLTLCSERDSTGMDMVVVSHLYALGCAIDASFPDLNGAALGAIAYSGIDEADFWLSLQFSQSEEVHPDADALMRFPRIVNQHISAVQRSSSQPSFQISHQPVMRAVTEFATPTVRLEQLGSGTPPYPPPLQYLEGETARELSFPPSPYLTSFPHTESQHERHLSTHSSGSYQSSTGLDPSTFNLAVPSAQQSPHFVSTPRGYSTNPEMGMFPGFQRQNSIPDPLLVPTSSGFVNLNPEIWV